MQNYSEEAKARQRSGFRGEQREMGDGLTPEQLKTIEENRRKAMERLLAKNINMQAKQDPNFVPFQPQPVPVTTSSAIPLKLSDTPPQTVVKPLVQAPQKLTKPDKSVRMKFELESSDYFACPHAPHLYDLIKEIPGAIFRHQEQSLAPVNYKRLRKESYWSIPLSQYSNLIQIIPQVDKPVTSDQIPDAVLKLFANPGEISRRKNTNGFDLGIIEETIRTSLFPFQRDGVQMALARNGRVILADDMGLGKSIQSLAIASYYRKEWPLLIISPASMVSSWHEQVRRWFPPILPDQISVLYDGKGQLNGIVNIGSFDLLAKLGDMVKSKQYKVVIVDESHALRNPDSKRSKALLPIIAKANRAILLSGTPALSRPIELFSQIKAVNPKLFPNYFEFGKRYCNGHQTPFGWDMKGASNLNELQVILESTIMIRRVKADVLTQLPPKIRQQVFLKINPKDLKYFASLNDKGSMMKINDLSVMEGRRELIDLWRKTGEAKLSAMQEYISDILEAGHKILVFAHHKNVMDAFEDAFMKEKRKYIRIDGATTTSLRQDICNKFQNDPTVRVALLSITAANTGLTLTAATTVVFAELYWNPGQMVQAEDRAHRIGQCDSVNVHYLLAKGTTDDSLWYIYH